MHPAAAIFILLCLTTVVILAMIFRHKQKMALIAQGINPLEPNPLKFYRRGLVLICLGIGAALISAANQGKPEAGGWAAVCILTIAVGTAYLFYYRTANRTLLASAPPAPASPPPCPPKVS
jgi:hypothetical protein